MKEYIFHKRLLAFLLCLWQMTFSFAQDGTIKGRVLNGNEDLPSATVSFGNQTMLTNNQGEFSVSLKVGNYILTVTHAGYEKIQRAVKVEAGNTQFLELIMTPVEQLGQVVILGSRSTIERSNLNTPVPIDIFSFGKLVETGQITLTQMLNFLSPSLNASREVLNEPVTLRGLDPQHVLILVNGIRYHNMAWLFSGGLKGQLGKGSVGNDLNSIPFPAIEKIEVLRDGAAAQYGSDAIAGVINIKLKKNTGTSFNIHAGQFYKSDGEKIIAGLYHGFSLKNKRLTADRQGILGLSAYYRNQAETSRGASYEGLIYLNYPTTGATLQDSINTRQQDDLLVKSRGFNRQAVIENAGNTKFISKGISINSRFPINERTEIFLTALVNSRKIDRGLFFRLPRDSSRINYILYRDGVKPRGRSNTVDVSFIAGVKGKTKNAIHWDISGSYGGNSVKGLSTNSYNETQTLILGANAQTSFYSGTDLFKQLISDVNFSKQFLQTANQIKTLNLAWGAEWRLENYQTKLGEEAFWKNYDTINYPRFNVSDHRNIVNKSRNVLGAYIELESEFKNNLLFNIAGRYEYYSDFGGNIAMKLATRYKLSSKIVLRASVNNGFRAPSLQQRYLTSIGYTLNSRHETIVGGIFPNAHKVVRAINVPLLTAEKTINVSGGFTSTILKNVSLTVDAYWIQIKNRIVLSGSFERIQLAGILNQYPELNAINRVSFFANAINTRTKGIDIVLDGNWSSKIESFGISLAANFNSTRLFGEVKTSDKLATISRSSNTLFNSEDIARIEKGQSGSKILLSTIYQTGKIKLMIRNTRFGKTMIAPLSVPAVPVENFSSKVLTDVSLSYSLKKWATVTMGANNIANIYPDRLKHYPNTSQGGWVYSPEASPFGFNGGYYFLSMSFNF